MNREPLEPYASPEEAAEFLKTNRLKIIRMARSGSLPAHPLGTGKRRRWRFKLSELDKHMQYVLARPCANERNNNGGTVSAGASQESEAQAWS